MFGLRPRGMEENAKQKTELSHDIVCHHQWSWQVSLCASTTGGDSKFHKILMSLVALNFNGGMGSGSDLHSVQGTTFPPNTMS